MSVNSIKNPTSAQIIIHLNNIIKLGEETQERKIHIIERLSVIEPTTAMYKKNLYKEQISKC